jgi:hypothetical protein
MTPTADEGRVYIREASELLDRTMGCLRKWDDENVLPKKLRPKRGDRGWRYWTPAQIDAIKQWIIDTERFPGKGLPTYNPTHEDAERQVRAMRVPKSRTPSV